MFKLASIACLLLLIALSISCSQGSAGTFPGATHRSQSRSSSAQNLLFAVTRDDFRNDQDLAVAKAQMDQDVKLGINAVELIVTWTPKQVTAGDDFKAVCNAYKAAEADGVTVVLNIIPGWKSDQNQYPPLTSSQQQRYATLAGNYEGLVYDQQNPEGVCTHQPVFYVSVGNEPNNDVFWKPQVASTPATYESLVAKTYDSIKKMGREIGVNSYVLAGETSSVGDTPTLDFIAGMVKAYRESGRKARIMDGYAHHPYGVNSCDSPENVHPGATIGTADYPRLVSALSGFDGTGQPGSSISVWYTEYGVQSIIHSNKSNLYKGVEPAASCAVEETTQGSFYAKQLMLANAQPTVVASSILFPRDEKDLSRWQPSLFYRDGTAKSSLRPVMAALRSVCGTCGLK